MAHVNHSKPREPAGYSGRKGAQESTENKAARKFDEMKRLGKKQFKYKGIQFVLCGGQFMEWSRADPRLIGR